MPYQLWSQDNFSKGELSPFMYARAQVQQYYDGLKQAQNVICYPTGAAGKRFGTLFQAIVNEIPAFNQFFFQTFQYLDECIYQVIFTPLNIDIYLEGILVAQVSTPLDGSTVFNLNYTILGAAFRVAGQGFKPYDLTRSPSTGNVITGENSNAFTLTTPVTQGLVLPVRFTNSGGALPTTNPQIKAGITYFLNYLTTSTAAIYATANDAKFDNNRFTISNAGTGTNTLIPQNTWTFANSVFKNLPFYDFTANYDSITFTPSATTGASVTLTASSAIFSSAYVGGGFIGGGGTARITAFTDTTHVTISVQTPFDSTNAIQGTLALLAEPAWSDARGWPQKCSSYQNRALFANTDSLPNGFWASVINDYTDFGDMTSDDDDAISWFPSSNDVNVIRFIVPFRSITVHTNSGIYSSPLADVGAITPNTFTLQLQDSTPADVLQPEAIDNQIFVLSGNDLHTMIWDGINNAYTSNIVSVVNEQVIRTPVDEATYADLKHAGSRYIFIVNESGSMAIYQTLQSEQVSGFTPAVTEQSYGESLFLQTASSVDGRAWFVVQREIANASSPVAISGFTANSLTAVGSDIPTNSPLPITFTTTGVLPTSVPQINTTQYFYGVGIDNDHFQVFLTEADALANINQVSFSNAGSTSNVVTWPLQTLFTLEELSTTVKLDCAIVYNGTPMQTITTGILYNAQAIKMLGDGFGYDTVGFNNQVSFVAHGQPVAVSQAYIGFPINLIIEPMPLAPPPGQQSTLTKPKHVRTIRFIFNNTVGGTVNGVPIAIEPFDQADIGFPPTPARGIFEMGLMSGWDEFNQPSFIIEHNDPFDIQLLGIFYSVDI